MLAEVTSTLQRSSNIFYISMIFEQLLTGVYRPFRVLAMSLEISHNNQNESPPP